MTRASVLILFAALASCSPKQNREKSTDASVGNVATESASAIDLSWRKQQGDFPKDKPGYLILTTEDALTYSKVLPEFVKQKEAMGFHVYVATEKDYGTGKTGNAQAASVRTWMRGFHQRAGLKYALLIGNPGPRSADLPSPTIPDCERGGLDIGYCDLDGAWWDRYLNATIEEVRAHPDGGQGSKLIWIAMKECGKREDEIIVSRINYVGNEIGTGAYDLDRILEKTIRYERDTVAGKNLDWRANALSCITNYGGGDWDGPLLKAMEAEGGMFEQRSDRGWVANLPPQNVVDGLAVNTELLAQTRRRGLAATCSHGWALGGEGIASTGDLMRRVDPRWPSAVAVAACTGFDSAFPCNTGQSWLRSGAIFAIGTSWSGNNNTRIPFLTRLLRDRVSVGEAGKNEVIQYGDPSLRVFPPQGAPVRELQISPVVAGHYEERTMYQNTPIKPLAFTYTLANRSKEPMKIAVETNAPWISFSTTSVVIKPGETGKVTATSNRKADTLAPGKHVADVRFRREDGQVDRRGLSLALQPLELTACYTFDAIEKDRHFPDLTMIPGVHRDARSLVVMRKKTAEPGKPSPGMEPVPGLGFEPQGRMGGALSLDKPAKGLSRGRAFGFPQWRGISASFWFKLGELPAANQTLPIMSAPFALTVNAAGQLAFTGNGSYVKLGTVKAGDWHFVQLRSDLANGKMKASLDGSREVLADSTSIRADGLILGSFKGSVDELKVWTGELPDGMVASEFAASGQPMKLPTPVPPSAMVALAEGGELRAPKEIPAAIDMLDPHVKLDLAGILSANQLTCTLRDAPEWLDLKEGVLSLKPGTDFDRIDFGGYDLFLVLTAKSGPFAGCVAEHPLKVRIPVPEVRVRIARAADNTLSFVSANPKLALGKGVIRYTTDGSPVTASSPAYEKPFKTAGDKVIARFFYLGEYPYAPVTMNSEFGITREKWKPLSVSGHPGTLAPAANAFDGKSETAWTHKGGTLPQALAWDLGESVTMTALSCHSTIANATGRIKDYVLHASDDGKTWRQVHTGTYADTPGSQRIPLEKPCAARYLKLEVTSLHGGKDAVIVELEVYTR